MAPARVAPPGGCKWTMPLITLTIVPAVCTVTLELMFVFLGGKEAVAIIGEDGGFHADLFSR